MNNNFQETIDRFLTAWRNSSLSDLSRFIDDSYQAREIRDGEPQDFGYEESIKGWEQAFGFVRENNGEWVVNQISAMELNEDEVMAVLTGTLILNGEIMKTGNLFFETFKKSSDGEWRIVRSYIETGVPMKKLNKMLLT
ncbi:flavoprotein [Evansella sp. LMS18]|uniref:flavoprotein n=1 Tax=Evansella sp. LMS18 TaxID=2924033 RepID=UPI0020D016A0|nr:flavoprotein [Evansella sp. LMS18]UTR10671.1 flavoprotein [Evansella sp. LMS18]